jgi:hypothetical protein
MTLALSRVIQFSSTSGTDDFTIDRPPLTNYRSLVYAAQHLSQNVAGPWTIYYLATGFDVTGEAWEIGEGTLTSVKPFPTLTRTTVHSSSNAGAKVSFLANTVQLSSKLPATARSKKSIQHASEWTFRDGTVAGTTAYPATWGNAPTASEGTSLRVPKTIPYSAIGNILIIRACCQYDTSINGQAVMGLHVSTDGGSTFSDAARCTTEFHVAGNMGQLYLEHIYAVPSNTGLQMEFRAGLATASCTFYKKVPSGWTAGQTTHGFWIVEFDSSLV